MKYLGTLKAALEFFPERLLTYVLFIFWLACEDTAPLRKRINSWVWRESGASFFEDVAKGGEDAFFERDIGWGKKELFGVPCDKLHSGSGGWKKIYFSVRWKMAWQFTAGSAIITIKKTKRRGQRKVGCWYCQTGRKRLDWKRFCGEHGWSSLLSCRAEMVSRCGRQPPLLG